ncbi:CHASE domain-containing protein [Hoeflea sp. AS16]|uniref:CHASE domain-containing protein n=1 Tax=Hoeflea sp. AS16 TaxID=3135779 RepID=UPI00317ACA26
MPGSAFVEWDGHKTESERYDMMQNGIAIFLARTFLVAVLYFASGRLGLLLAVPPGYATVIWPPSGIALGALIIFGWRLWPAILLGSFLLNSYISGAYSAGTGLAPEKALTAFAIATGSTLQSLAGYALVRRFIGLPLNFNRLREVLLLFIVAGPVTCVVAATTGVMALFYAGVLPADQVLENWLTWWSGDVFGIIVFLPLMMMAPGTPQRLTWRGNFLDKLPLAAMLIVLVPLGLTFYAWNISSEAAANNGNIQFEALTIESKKALLSRIISYDNALLGGVAFFQGSQRITRDEWRRYVDMLRIEESLPGINGLGWIASKAPGELDNYVQATRDDGAPTFELHPRDVKDGNYIITYIEPEKINLQALGLNIAFEENRKQAADLSRDTGKPAITKRIILVQDEEKTPGFLLLYPMYNTAAGPGASTEENSVFDGWIYAPFSARNFMNGLTESQGNTLNMRVYDGDTEDPAALIYNSRNGHTEDSAPAFSKREQIEVMQQKWLIVWESTLGFEQSSRNTNPILVLAGGLLITFLLAMFLFVTTIWRTETFESMLGRKVMILPAVVFSVLAVGSISLYSALTDKELHNIQALISSETHRNDLLVAAEIESKMSALKRMVGRLELAQGQSAELWQADAHNYLEDLKGLRVLARIGAEGSVLQFEQSPRNERTVWVDAILQGSNGQLGRNAIRHDNPRLSAPVVTTAKDSALVAYFPLTGTDVSSGYLASVFSVAEFFDGNVSHEVLERYQFRITHNGQTQFMFGNQTQATEDGWTFEMAVQILNKKWILETTPTSEFVRSQRTQLPSVVLIAGFLIAILSAMTAHMTLLSRLKTAYLEKSNALIKEEATRNSTVMNTVSDGVLTINSEGLIETINPAGLRLFGYSKAEILGKNINMLMPMPYRADHDGYLNRYLTSGERKIIGTDRQVSASRKDGSVFPIDLSVNEMNLDGKRTFVGTIRDTSEAVAAAQALHESNTLKSAILASTEYMIIATDLHGNVMVFNEAAETVLGYTAEEVVGKQTPALWHDQTEVMERAQALSTELGVPVEPGFEVFTRKTDLHGIDENEWTYIRKDGSHLPVELTVTPMRDETQQITGYLGVILDITKRKEIDRLKSDFVSIVSHELRTPLTSIRGALGLAAGPMAKELPEKANRLIDIAHKNCERLTLLINDILDIDKIESGQMRFEMKPEELGELLRQAVEVNQPYADKLGVVLKVADIDPGLSSNVDAARFAQVMANLLSNAAKFSNRGSHVDVSARCINDRIRISVKDYGSGIPDEFRPQIFGKFSQGDSSSTRIKGGSGLGLHISKQIVERMGGTIGFDSEPGKETTFWVELPQPSQAHVTGRVNQADIQRSLLHCKQREAPTLLHIEDDEDLSRVLSMSLQGKIEVVPAATLKDAEELLRTRHFDLVVLDIELPDGSGLQLLETITDLADPPVPVMILSASEVSSEVEKSVASAMVKSRASEPRIIEKIETLIAEQQLALQDR